MKLHSIVDCITNSSSVTYIRPLDDALFTTKDLLKKLMNAMGIEGEVEDYFKVFYQISDDWFWLAIEYSLDIALEFLKRENILGDNFWVSFTQSEQEKIVAKFKEEVLEKFNNNTLDFDFGWDEDNNRDWGRWINVIIEPKSGDNLNLNDIVLSIFSPNVYEDN
jgi:hypothetical protein